MSELRQILRRLLKRPALTTVTLVTLALGIGATTTLFAIANAVLLRPLPYPEADRIVSISESHGREDRVVARGPNFFSWRRSSHSLSAVAAYSPARGVLTGAGDPVGLDGAAVSADFFTVFAARPAFGRLFRADEDVAGANSVLLLSHDLWKTRLLGDSAALGRSIALDGTPFTVIGVMPAGFAMPRGAAYWVPQRLPENPGGGITLFTQVVGRLKPGIGFQKARAEMAALVRRGDAQRRAEDRGDGVVMMMLHERMFGATRPALLLLFGAMGFLLLIACTNVANLQLVQAAARRKEFAVRLALGASRWRLVRQLLYESVLLSGAGAALGLLVPIWSLAFFVRLSPASVARVEGIHVDGAVLAFTAATALATGVLFGLVPALWGSRADAFTPLKEGGTHTTGTGHQNRVRQGLVIAEIATALVLLTGAGLLAKSFVRELAVDPGFMPDHVLAADISLPRVRYPNDTSARALFDRIAERVRGFPGVVSVALYDAHPPGGFRMTMRVTNQGKPPVTLAITVGSAGFPGTIGLRLERGRFFDAGDKAGTPTSMLVSESAARAYFPSGDAVGQQLALGGFGNGHPTVVGIVKDVPEPGVEAAPVPKAYFSFEQVGGHPCSLVVRTNGDPRAFESAIRRVVLDLDPQLPVSSLTTMEEDLAKAVAPRRFNSLIIGVFAALALLLAAVGLYGVMAYQVAQRTQELGIRMALGAGHGSVLTLVLRQGMALVALGIAGGLAVSFALSHVLVRFLYGVGPRDAATFAVAPVALAVVAALACWIPARRATTVDPAIALRNG